MIFFIDDSKEFLSLYEDYVQIYLESKTINCRYYDNGMKALEELNKYNPKIIITDYRMPEISGASLAHEAKKHNPEIKIILVSEDSYMIQSHLESSPFDILCGKEFDAKVLFKTIEDILKYT